MSSRYEMYGELEESSNIGTLSTVFLLAVLMAALSTSVGVSMWGGANTQPVLEDFGVIKRYVTEGNRNPQTKEGFAGPTKGAGTPDCLSSSSECAQLSEMLSSRRSKTEEGPDDIREMKVILSKISCLKRDLLGNAKVVQATRYQPFNTSHDLEPVAETAARCFSRTIPQRDLMLSFDKWGSRGTFLLKRICTSLAFSDGEEEKAIELFGQAMADLIQIALGECCTTAEAVIGGVPQKRMVGGFTPPSMNAHRPYEGYY
jgi:hypothetical protein